MSNNVLDRCGEDSLKLVADFWVLRIVEEISAADAPLRFCEVQRRLEGVSPVTLTARLRSLHERGLVARLEGSKGKASVTYELTDRGRQVIPVIQAIKQFATSE